MRVADLITLYDFNYWANARLMKVLDRLSDEELTQKIGGGHDSIRSTLVHIMSAESGWLERCGGPARGPRLNPAEYPTLASIRQAWAVLEQKVRAFLGGLTDSDLDRQVRYSNDRGDVRQMPLGDLMQHAANHGVHHKGQISLMLRLIGYEPEDVDLLIYCGEKRGVPPW
ncbi:MAG TPA: DinB family protein [Blastocatellia bacterium]|nr:DinB family protein [Blastocatellia bacterium]